MVVHGVQARVDRKSKSLMSVGFQFLSVSLLCLPFHLLNKYICKKGKFKSFILYKKGHNIKHTGRMKSQNKK